MNNQCWWGQTKTEEPKSPTDIDHAHITLVTTETDHHRSAPLTRIQLIALHEVGHSLGLIGHSPSMKDVMYATKTERQSPRQLSTGDLETLAHLYRPDAKSLEETVQAFDLEGRQLSKNTNFQGALEKFDLGLQLKPRSSVLLKDKLECLIEQSQHLIHAQQYADAVPVLRKAFDSSIDDQLRPGTHVQVTRDLAAVYERLGKYPAAISTLHELSFQYKRLGKVSEAKAVESSINNLSNRNK
jgi:tetratricopeptide (TPR) repeat protein